MEFQKTVNNITERAFLGDLFMLLQEPMRISTRDYAEQYRWLSSEVTSDPGRMDCLKTPFMLFPMECFDDPSIPVVVARKSAQIAWTETTNSYYERIIRFDPRNILIAFPRLESAKKFSREKIKPLVKSSKELLELIGDPEKCSFKFFKFPGGWLSLLTARTTEDLKSSSAPLIIVEEPDGLKGMLSGQGDALDMLIQRQKTYPDRKLIYGGTPTIKEFSRIDLAYEQSNKGVYLVPCRSCHQLQVFDFRQLRCDDYPNRFIHDIYGKRNPDTAHYVCKNCDAEWDDADRKWSILEALNYNNLGWKFLREEEKDIYGFAFCELMSMFSASTHVELMKRKIKAELALERGEEGLMVSFINNTCGEAYSFKSINLEVKDLIAKRLNYIEGVVPLGGLVLTAGIDVQHNRFAIVVRARGRKGNSWLITWTEIWGNVLDPEDEVWAKLTQFVTTTFPSEEVKKSGDPINLRIAVSSIDASDGTVSGLVYSWVKAMNDAGYLVRATKGASDTDFNAEIYTDPALPDEVLEEQKARAILAARMGVPLFIMGAHRAHEEVLRKIQLTGASDRYFHCETSYGGNSGPQCYEEQILSCVKKFSVGKQAVSFELKPGKRKEAIDCEKLSLHAFHSIGGHIFTEEHWKKLEEQFNI